MNIKNFINSYITSKLFNSDKKSAKVNNEQLPLQNKSDDDDKDFKSTINTAKELNKNSWLHTSDNFGRLEKGKVL
jgi:hypothetical protein